jgi:7-cyano-7-deazaguanine synthase in queuosine biosynthesis
MKLEKKEAPLLLSGGIDSATRLDFLRSNSYKSPYLFINCVQSALKNEQEASKKLTKHYKSKTSGVQ